MKRVPAIAVTAVLVVLSLLALDDITTGTEPSFWLEWTVVAATVLWLGGLATVWVRRRA